MNDSWPSRSRLLVIGNPQAQRVKGFCDAWRAAGGLDGTIVSHQSLLKQHEQVDGLSIVPGVPTLIRIDSTGEDADVHRRILERGGDSSVTAVDLHNVQSSGRWYRG